jgi:hypothetical protein
MDHIVYLDVKAQKLPKLLSGDKQMLIRGATGRKMPYTRVNARDVRYFINNNGEGLIRAKAIVRNDLNSERLTVEESAALVAEHQAQLQLTAQQIKRWAGRRYLVLIAVEDVVELDPFTID